MLDREALVRKIQFPRLVIPLSIVLCALFNLGLNLIVVLHLRARRGRASDAQLAGAAVIIVMLVVFATGLAMLLSSLFVYFRDMQPIWEVVTQVLFYASPVIIPVTLVQEQLSPTLLNCTCSTRSP